MELEAIFADLPYACYKIPETKNTVDSNETTLVSLSADTSVERVSQYLIQAQIFHPQYKNIFQVCRILESTKDFVFLQQDNNIHLCIRGTFLFEKRDIYNGSSSKSHTNHFPTFR